MIFSCVNNFSADVLGDDFLGDDFLGDFLDDFLDEFLEVDELSMTKFLVILGREPIFS
jgi:hypothetical protein